MKEIDKKAKATLTNLFELLIPSAMNSEERNDLAKRAGINPESLRVMKRRKTINADTLIRLLLARGVSSKTLENLPQTDFKQLSNGESDWIQLGRELDENEKLEFAALIRFVRAKWKL